MKRRGNRKIRKKRNSSKKLFLLVMTVFLIAVISGTFLIESPQNIRLVRATKTFAEISSPNLSNTSVFKRPNIKAEKLEVDKNKINLFKGETQYIHANVLPSNASNKGVRWKSGDSSVAKITESGQVIAQKVGKCKVFCVLQEDNKVMQKVDVNVQEKYPEKINVEPRNVIKIKTGQKSLIKASVYPTDADDKTLEWSTSDSSVATVNNGVVTGKKNGVCIISAAIKDIPSLESSVKVLVSKDFFVPEADSPHYDSKIIDVPYICQNPQFPTGCESVSTVMALNYVGVNISVDDFIDKYLYTTDIPFDPQISFGGDPRGDGYGCYAPVIEDACEDLIRKEGENIHLKRLEGKSIDYLCGTFIDENIPVIFWATQKMLPSEITQSWKYYGKTISWVAPEHCLLLVGYDKDYYYFNDPLEGKQIKYLKEETEDAYESLGSQAVVLIK